MPVQAMFVVPKRTFKRAHDRNKLKRRMREAYRLNKQALYEALDLEGRRLVLAFIYVGKKQEEFLTIESSLKKLMQQTHKKKPADA